ncbi:MAG: TetR/AcrR family transcriptional regulator [Bacteroidales bacterium]|nr:TetR/AcrR family transcriptional regulator [Bacteroidales bacterium]
MSELKIDKTREKIIQVAEKLFGRFGFYKTSMDEIAKIARKAKGSLYYHFSSKEELFKEVVAKEIRHLKNELSSIINNESLNSKQKIKQYLLKRMEVLSEASNYHETIKADLYEHFEFIDDIRASFDNWEKQKIKESIEAGINTNEFDVKIEEIDAIIDVFLMVLKGLEIPFFIQGNYQKYSPYLGDMLNILIKGISK